MTAFWIALQFLTRCPVRLNSMPTPQQNAQSLLFYPLVGLLIGVVLYGGAVLLHALPPILLSSMILVVWIGLTGALHLDGLADTADAWVGGFGDKARTLAIMKDPNCGPMGVISLVLLCIMKWSTLYVLLEQQLDLALLICPMLGRLAPLFFFLTTPYARENGLGRQMVMYLNRPMATALVLLLPLTLLYWRWSGVVILIVFYTLLVYLRHQFIQRLDGVTGDNIGASVELIEVMMLLSLVVSCFYHF